MKRLLHIFFSLHFFSLLNILSGQTLTTTNLPIVFINTNFQSIPDEPKIKAGMAIVDNGYNVTNNVTDTSFTYYGNIAIEQRGSISQQWWWLQKSYGVTTQNANWLDTNVKLMGMPKESDWILYGPFNEATLMKNTMTYELIRELGYYVTRTKYCEMMLKTGFTWNYNGVYVMMEKIKRDNNRVNISKLDLDDNAGDSLTGGYIFAVDKNINAQDSGWFSSHPQSANLYLTYKYPNGTSITAPQKNYIQAYVDSFENSLSSPTFANPATGFRKYIEPTSFMDFFFIQELSKNVDAYKRSSYLYKDKNSKDPRLHAGPHWDYNSAWKVEVGGCESFDSDTGWVYDMTCWIHGTNFPVPFWWKRMLQDTSYTHDLKCRWMQLRATTLSTANIFHVMDSISNYISTASTRHYQKFGIAGNLSIEVNNLKTWISARLAWMDANMPGNCWDVGVPESSFENSFSVYPNPTSDEVNIDFYLGSDKNLSLELFDAVGRKVNTIEENKFHSGNNSLKLDMQTYPSGIYLLKVKSDISVTTKKIILE